MDTWFVIFLITIAFFVGITTGAVLTVTSLGDLVNDALEGTTFNVEVDINETQMVDAASKLFKDKLNVTKELESVGYGNP